MKIKTLVIFLIILTSLYNCKKDDISNPDRSCVKTETTFYEFDEDSSWVKYFYTNEYNTKIESSGGVIRLFEYDILGNITKKTTVFESGSEFVHIYEYDNMNNDVKSEYYKSGMLDSYIVKTYSENQILSTYYYNSSNAVTGWKKYHYQNDLLSQIEIDNSDVYFYYSTEIDSIITMDKDNSITSKAYKKYSGEYKIYESVYNYDLNNNVTFYQIRTWEYNSELLVRETADLDGFYIDTKYFYESNLLQRKVTYMESGALNSIELYQYDENDVLIRVDYFDNNSNLESYKIIESTCI